MSEEGVWSEALICRWLAWSYVGGDRLRLDMPEGTCCDMNGAIKIAEELLPTVMEIQTFAGGKRGTFYTRYYNGEWEAQCVREGKDDA